MNLYLDLCFTNMSKKRKNCSRICLAKTEKFVKRDPDELKVDRLI